MILTYFLIAIITLCYILYYYFTRTFSYWKSRNVVGPKPVPLFGNLQDSALRKKNITEVFKDIYDQFPNEKVVGLYRMTTPCLLLKDLDVIKHILIKDFEHFTDRGLSFSEKGIGNNLFLSNGDKWRILRTNFTPIFTSGKLKNMVYLLEQRGDKFIEFIQKICLRENEHELHSLVQKYTIAAISACAFGLEIDTITDKLGIFAKIDDIIFSPTVIDEVDMMFPGLLKKLNLEPFPKDVRNFFEQLVSTVITQRNGTPTNRKDFMDLILELRQKGEIQGGRRSDDKSQGTVEMTDEMIAAQAFVFYVGGYETSATTMSFMLYELAKNSNIQNKLISEVDEVLKKYDGKLTFEALNELTYMEQVFDEILRLYPIADPLQRRAKLDYKIPGTDVTVKKDQIVIISCLGIHHDERHYPDPEKFDPERFTNENSSARHTCAYMPFGTGPRNCIGMRFAKIQSRVCMTKFLAKFRVEPSKRTLPTMKFGTRRFVLGSDGGIYLNIIPRNK